MIDADKAKKEVLDWIAEAVQSQPEQIDQDKPLPEVGLDSSDAVHLVCTVEAVLQTELPEDVMEQVGTVRDILAMIDAHVAAAQQSAA